MTQNWTDPIRRVNHKGEKAFTIRDAEGTEYFGLPKMDLPQLVVRYTNELIGAATQEWCKCPWEIHPDDRDIRSDCCRTCNDLRDYHDSKGCKAEICECVKFEARRMRRKDDDPLCPVHTKEGFILGFFEWVFA